MLFPKGINHRRFQRVLLSHLERSCETVVAVVDLSGATDLPPFEALKSTLDYYGVDSTVRVLEDLVPCNDTEPEVFLVTSFEGLPLPRRQEWVNALDRWAGASTHYPADGRRKICIVTPADSLPDRNFPSPDVTVSVRMWWGIPSALEARLACRLASQERIPVTLWREHLLPSLAGSDLEFGEHLWDLVTEDLEEILEGMAAYGAARGWSRQEAEEVYKRWTPIPPGRGWIPTPPKHSLSFWAQGWIVYTPEYGGEIHSALLALLRHEHEIAHRIWRAQAVLLMPVVDSARLSIYEHLSRRFGIGWLDWRSEREGMSLPELGLMENALRGAPVPKDEKQQWLRVVRMIRRIRNDLAHYTPISFGRFVEFWERVGPILRIGRTYAPT